MLVDAQGFVVNGPGDLSTVVKVPTVRTSPITEGEGGRPLAAVWHTTDTTGDAAERIARRWAPLLPSDRKASANLLIGRKGVVYSLAPVTLATWHTARPESIGGGLVPADMRFPIRGRTVRYPNHATIGIEIENAGRVKLALDGKAYAWPYKVDPTALVEKFDKVDGGLYETFPDVQIRAAEEVVKALAAHFPEWGRQGFEYGHVDFDPDRKLDPWPLWRKVVGPAVLDLMFSPPRNLP